MSDWKRERKVIAVGLIGLTFAALLGLAVGGIGSATAPGAVTSGVSSGSDPMVGVVSGDTAGAVAVQIPSSLAKIDCCDPSDASVPLGSGFGGMQPLAGVLGG